MEAVLSPPMDPVAITPEPYIQKTETTLIVRCLDRVFKSVTALDASAGAALFTVTSKGMGSYSWRRNVRDAAEERPLFDLRHTGFGMINKWAVESPSGRQVATLQHIKYQGKERSDIDAHPSSLISLLVDHTREKQETPLKPEGSARHRCGPDRATGASGRSLYCLYRRQGHTSKFNTSRISGKYNLLDLGEGAASMQVHECQWYVMSNPVRHDLTGDGSCHHHDNS
ncbi:hypothetical protein M8818_003262 [Zalaria obscura]|uniref:Uncharacterized protein n=1 Tax=Zalaria obscura TaxID=2024903 RepID=A0ACC3SGI9_9PEZI